MSLWTACMSGVMAAAIATQAMASCAPKFSYCQKLPVRGDEKTAIFLGVVKGVVMPPESASVRDKVYPAVSFKVAEAFLNAESSEIDVWITSDVFLGNVRGRFLLSSKVKPGS